MLNHDRACHLRGSLAPSERAGHHGLAFTSPDIVPLGTKPIPSPTSPLLAEFAQDLGQPIVPGGLNQIFVRGRYESRTGALLGARMYDSGNAIVPWPARYQRNPLRTIHGFDVNPISQTYPGTLFALPNPYLYSAGRANRPSGFVADVDADEAVRSDLAAIRDLEGLVAYRLSKPHLVTRNVTVVPTLRRSADLRYELYTGTTARDLILQIRCHRVAVGWTVSLGWQQGDGPCETLIPPTRVTEQEHFAVGVRRSFPAGTHGTLTLSYDAHDLAPQRGWRIECEVLMVQEPSSPLFRHGRNAVQLGHWDPSYGDEQAVRAVPVGGASVAAPSAAAITTQRSTSF